MLKQTKIIYFLILVLLIGLFGYINLKIIPGFSSKNTISASNSSALLLPQETIDFFNQNNIKIFTNEELKSANTKNKCYIAYKGIVYDVTNHPLWKDCEHSGYVGGIDATHLFPHPTSYLNAITKVGVLSNYILSLNKNQLPDLVKSFKKGNIRSIDLKDFKQHSTYKSCWIIVNDYVYDVTNFIPQHPGGSDIISGCGKDLSSLFSQGIHKDKGQDYLFTYKLGKITKNY